LSQRHADAVSFFENLQPFFGKGCTRAGPDPGEGYIFGFNFRYNGISLGLPLATLSYDSHMLGRTSRNPSAS
jgi:hypothetical protein